ncbi:MAG: chromate transporter [Ruminococcaceae bacterium]|nr:chromate transporter [Oscillospiraceae bacterium]
MTFLLIFWEFFKTGLFAVGGGLATIPFLMKMAENYNWFDAEELSNMIAVSESTPGPIGINMATYVGYTSGVEEYGILGGIFGALIATTALVLPSLVIIMIIAGFLQKFRQSSLVEKTFFCLRPATIGLLAVSLISMMTPLFFNFAGTSLLEFFDLKAVALFGLLLFGILKFKKHPIIYIAIGAAAGIIFKF